MLAFSTNQVSLRGPQTGGRAAPFFQAGLGHHHDVRETM